MTSNLPISRNANFRISFENYGKFLFLLIFIYSYIHIFIYSYIHIFIYSYIHIFIYTYIHIFIYSYSYSYSYSYGASSIDEGTNYCTLKYSTTYEPHNKYIIF